MCRYVYCQTHLIFQEKKKPKIDHCNNLKKKKFRRKNLDSNPARTVLSRIKIFLKIVS